MANRRKFSSAFKVKVALEALKEKETLLDMGARRLSTPTKAVNATRLRGWTTCNRKMYRIMRFASVWTLADVLRTTIGLSGSGELLNEAMCI